jgi:hypothetical protein
MRTSHTSLPGQSLVPLIALVVRGRSNRRHLAFKGGQNLAPSRSKYTGVRRSVMTGQPSRRLPRRGREETEETGRMFLWRGDVPHRVVGLCGCRVPQADWRGQQRYTSVGARRGKDEGVRGP